MAIMQWKKEAAGYRAHWQGIQFLLTEHPTTHKWQLFANNRHVKEEYRSLHAAISDIETRQEKLVIQAAKEHAGRGSLTSAEARTAVTNGASVHREARFTKEVVHGASA